MRDKKRAFTLTEVLITLSIIGVLAALIMPGLRNSMSRDSRALSLARTVELFQHGITEIFNEVQQRNIESSHVTELSAIKLKDLYDADSEGYLTDEFNLMEAAGSFMGVEKFDDYNVNLIKDYSGNVASGDLTKDANVYRFKKLNSVVIFQKIPSTGVDTAKNDEILTRVVIDVNGVKPPNLLANDVFLFGLSNNGQLIPAGSEAYNNNIYGDDVESYQEGCKDSIDTGISCAARVASDGWKINY